MQTPRRPTRGPSRRRFVAVSSALAGAAATPWLHAQPARFPSRQIRIVVPFPPGGLTDAYARLYGEQLTQQLGAGPVGPDASGSPAPARRRTRARPCRNATCGRGSRSRPSSADRTARA